MRARSGSDSQRRLGIMAPVREFSRRPAVPRASSRHNLDSSDDTNSKLREENAILGKAIEELMKAKRESLGTEDQGHGAETSADITIRVLRNENKVLRDRVTSWKSRALQEAALVDELRKITGILPDKEQV